MPAPRRLSTNQPIDSAGRNGFAARTPLTWELEPVGSSPPASKTDHEHAWWQSLSARTPETYAQQAHAPAAKLPEDDLVFFLLDIVPTLDL